MKITLVIHALTSGGAERVVVNMANYWANLGCDVTIITLVDRDRQPFYPLDPRINLQQLGIIGDSPQILSLLRTSLRRLKILRSAIIDSQPDVAISFMNTVCVMTLVSCWNAKFPIIVSEHRHPTYPATNKAWKVLMKLTYRHADLVTLLTQDALRYYRADHGYRSMVMPNPIITPVIEVVTERLLPPQSLIAIGRLQRVKGFDLLLKAFHQLRNKYPEWQLTILGEGPMRSELEALRSQLQLTDRVHLPGQVQNVNAHLRQAELFVMPSRFEGFPMALCEAMACGVPVLSTDCLSGPSDIIRAGIDGMLVAPESIDALVTGLDALMSDPIKRQQLAQAAPQVLERFGIDRVMKMWDEAIEQIIDRRTQSAKIRDKG